MDRNTILEIAKLVSYLIIFSTISVYLVIMAGIIHWHFEPSFYSDWDVTRYFAPSEGIGFANFDISNDKISLSNVSNAIIYWFVIKLSVMLFLANLVLAKGLEIFKSIKSLNIFYTENIKHFKSIGKYTLIIFLINSIYLYMGNGSENYALVFKLEILLFSLASFIIAEIFVEGKKLQGEKDQII